MNISSIANSGNGIAEMPVRLPINAVERETGVSKELLRMWERRYHFPTPDRDDQGDRIYSLDQVNKLRLLRRLIDAGFRPGKIITMAVPDLENLLRSQNKTQTSISPEIEKELIEVMQSKDPHSIREYLSHQMIKLGLQTFIIEFLQHANFIIGEAWMQGIIEVHEEHLYTEQVQSLIRTAITNLRAATEPPHIMLTTAPEESHALGILMVEAMMRLDNVDAICFGAQMPIRDIAQAASKHKMNIVALSFSASYPTSKAIEFLEELRFRLPLSVDIWAGGNCLRSTRRSIEAVEFFHDLESIRKAVTIWRRTHGTGK